MTQGLRIFSPKPAVLEVLLAGPNYSTGIKKAVERRTGGHLMLGVFRLYRTLWTLERDGLLRSREGETTPERGGRPRIYYELTEEGVRVALEIRDEVHRFYHPDPDSGSREVH